MNVLRNYIELHTHSYYSLLDGASSPEQLVNCAASLGMSALALTDHDAVYGAIPFQQGAQQVGIRPIHGAEMTLDDGRHLTLLVQNQTGWANLCVLITLARNNAPKGQALLPEACLEAYTDGLIALTGCRQGILSHCLREPNQAAHLLEQYRAWFGGQVWVELQHHRLPHDTDRVEALVALAHKTRLGIVATNNVHYAQREEHTLQDVLTCIRHITPLDEARGLLRPNSEYALKSAQEMGELFQDYPDAIENTQAIADQCQFEIRASLQDLPEYPHHGFSSARDYVWHLADTSPHMDDSLRSRASEELVVIERAGLSNYFLMVWDIVRYAREQGIRCQGRGSAANSVIAYLLYISPVNPVQHDLVFERFLSAERQVAPDIDIDFDAARREEVIQYVYERYGHDHAAMACTFSTYRARSALRDVGKTLGYAPSIIDLWAKGVDGWMTRSVENALVAIPEQVKALCHQISGLPRHLSIHNGGMIIMRQPLSERLPAEPATMEDRFVVQWDKDALEDAGLVKIDILGLRMLSAISAAVELSQVDLDSLTYDDPAVYHMISFAETIGVFQVESRAQAQMLPRFQPRTFNDLIIAISLIRPGPIQGEMVHPYLRRRTGQEQITYLHPSLEPALKETLGVILFQEQVLKVARDFAGFTAGQGELLRRALGRKNATEALLTFEQQFVAGAIAKGIDAQLARTVFQKLLGFGSYSFPKSHAAAFAVLVYQSAWLRKYQPAAFYIALLNNQPMGFWQPSVLINDAKRRGLKVLPVSVHHSQAICSLEGENIRIGFNYIKGLSKAQMARLCEERQQHPFANLDDFCRRTQLRARKVENLIQAGAMDIWGDRRALLWEVGRIASELALVLEHEPDNVDLPELDWIDTMNMEQDILGFSTDIHLMARLRDALDERNILSSIDLNMIPVGEIVMVAGVVVVRQAPPTAKGYRFLTMEDEYGFMNIIVKPAIYEQFRHTIRTHNLLLVRGEIQKEGRVVNVVMRSVERLGVETMEG